jgi:hypothetical protein
MRDMCKSSLFAQFHCQAQILILEIPKSITPVKIFAFLELEQKLSFYAGLDYVIRRESKC